MQVDQCNTPHQKKKEKPHDHTNRCREIIICHFQISNLNSSFSQPCEKSVPNQIWIFSAEYTTLYMCVLGNKF